MSEEKGVILGSGNILMGDDGIGVYVVRELYEDLLHLSLGTFWNVMDAGTSSLDTILSFENVGKLIIVDALELGNAPGTIYKYSFPELKNEFLNKGYSMSSLSLHQVDLFDSLVIAERLGKLPKETIILGIEPEKIDWNMGLSASLSKKMPEIVRYLMSIARDYAFNKGGSALC